MVQLMKVWLLMGVDDRRKVVVMLQFVEIVDDVVFLVEIKCRRLLTLCW